jgi:hypothetical protein
MSVSMDTENHNLMVPSSMLVLITTESINGMFFQLLWVSFFLFSFANGISYSSCSVNVLKDVLNDSSRFVEDSMHEHYVDLGEVGNGAFVLISVIFLNYDS